MLTREEFAEEIRLWTPEANFNRLMRFFDEVQHDLGHVGALYENLKRVTAEKVAAEVRAEEAEQRILHLERQLAAARAESDDD